MFEQLLPQKAKNSLGVLGKSGLLKDGYLAGGTALALQIGHRVSVDFDFFTEKHFDSFELAGKISQIISGFVLDRAEKDTLLATFEKTRFSLFFYSYPLLEKPTIFSQIQIASIKDIAAMKLAAISSRGVKRDFIDLYFIIHEQKALSLKEIFELYDRKFAVLRHNKLHILRSLIYFAEADTTEMPKMLKPVEWREVKRFFERETKYLVKREFEFN